jgi:hypothetical protein
MHLLSLLTAVSALPLPFDFRKDVLEPAQRFGQEYRKALAISNRNEAKLRRARLSSFARKETNRLIVNSRPTWRYLRNNQ